MRVLHLIPTNKVGGVPKVLNDLILSTSSVDHFIFGEIEHDGFVFDVSELHLFNGKMRSFSFITFRNLYKIVKAERIDVIHSHGKGPGFYSRILKLFLRVKVVHTFHGFHNRFEGLLGFLYYKYERILVSLSDVLVVLSPSEKLEVEQKLKIRNSNSCLKVVPNIYRGRALPGDMKLDSSKFIIGSIGRMSVQKNQKLILRIAERLKHNPSILFVLIGGPSLEDSKYYYEVRSYVEEYDLNNVLLLGEIRSASSYIGGFDIFLSTSRWEGLPTVLLEAFDFGVPVIASTCIGNRDLISLDTGVPIEQEDENLYIDAIFYLMGIDAEERLRIASRQRKILVETYSKEVIVDKLIEVYSN